jgi:hypothetical protein
MRGNNTNNAQFASTVSHDASDNDFTTGKTFWNNFKFSLNPCTFVPRYFKLGENSDNKKQYMTCAERRGLCRGYTEYLKEIRMEIWKTFFNRFHILHTSLDLMSIYMQKQSGVADRTSLLQS